MTEWLIAVTLCFLNLPNAPAPMCMPAYVPLTFQEEEKCEVAKINFINYFDPIAREKELSMIFKCVPMPSGQVPLPQLQENFYQGYTARSGERFSNGERKHIRRGESFEVAKAYIKQ